MIIELKVKNKRMERTLKHRFTSYRLRQTRKKVSYEKTLDNKGAVIQSSPLFLNKNADN